MGISEKLNKKTYIVCPECSAITLAVRRLGIWTADKCPGCSRKIDIKNMKHTVVTCENCGNSVIFNALSDGPQQCPNCSSSLPHPISTQQYQQVPCPRCGNRINVNGQSGNATCPLCSFTFDIETARAKKKQQESTQPVLIEYGANTNDIIWKHPQNSFPTGSILIVKEGTTAILLENGKQRAIVGPGRYPLDDSSLSLTQKLNALTMDYTYLTDIYFVQNHLSRVYKWGTAYPSEIRDRNGVYSVTAYGTLNLIVQNPRVLAGCLNFADVSRDNPDGTPGDDLIADLVVKQVGLCFEKPFQELVTQNGWELRTLTRTDVAHHLIKPLNDHLQAFGLELQNQTFQIENLQCTETAVSRQEREMRERLFRTIEQPVSWTAEQLRVHMKDNIPLYADVVLAGSVTAKVDDLTVLLDSSLGRSIIEDRYSVLLLQAQLNRILTDLFSQILQPMIDDTGVDIREMNRYYSYLKQTAVNALNFAMKRHGISFENFTIEQKSFDASDLLNSVYQNEGLRTSMLDEEKMRRFTQSMKLVEKKETGEYEVEILKSEVETGEKKDLLKDRQSELEHHDLNRTENAMADKMNAQTRLVSLQYDNDYVILQKKFKADLAAEEHKVDMQDMLHRIDQSDLNWREKLDEYARLRRNLDFQDEQAHKTQAAEAEYTAEHTLLQLTEEEQALQNELKDLDAKRAEERKQADFSRILELKKAKWEKEAESLKLEKEAYKYKVEMDYLSKVDFNRVSFEAARAAAEREYAERLRAQKDRDDTTFVTRSHELMDQIRAFRSELGDQDAGKDGVSLGAFDAVLNSLQSVVESVSSGGSGSNPAVQGTNGDNAIHFTVAPSGGTFIPDRIRRTY